MENNPRCSTCGAPAVVTLTLHGDNVPGPSHYCQHHWQRFAGYLARVGEARKARDDAGGKLPASKLLRIVKGGKDG